MRYYFIFFHLRGLFFWTSKNTHLQRHLISYENCIFFVPAPWTVRNSTFCPIKRAFYGWAWTPSTVERWWIPISMASQVAAKWKCIENDNIYLQRCSLPVSLGAFTSFLHLVSPHAGSLVCGNSAAALHSTSWPAENTWKQFSFNQVHRKGSSDANLSNATILFTQNASPLHLSPLYWFFMSRMK